MMMLLLLLFLYTLLVTFVGAEVRSINFAELLKAGVLHTKLWIVDGLHAYVGSANMDYRSLTQALTDAHLLNYLLTFVFLFPTVHCDTMHRHNDLESFKPSTH